MADADMFLSTAAQQNSLFSGFNNTATSGFSQLGSLNLILQPILAQLASKSGMYPGQFMPTHGVSDLLRADVERSQAQAAMTNAAKTHDTETWLRTSEGMYRTLGVDYGLDQQVAFRQTYQQFAPMMSMLAQMAPGLVDSLHGSRGSATLLNMGLTKGGRYRSDADGMPTMSGQALESLTTEIKDSLYGTPQAVSEMRGIGMGSLGQIFDEASRRGYLPASIGANGRDAAIKRLSQEEQKTITELEAGGDIDDKLRNFDSKRIAGRLKELSGSVSAMRDIFGSMGQTDAPRGQLMNALEMLTQNRLSSMAPGQVEQIVRQTKSLMQTTGMSLDGIMRLTAQSSAYGQQLGLAPEISIQSAMGSVAYSHGYKDSFGGFRGFNAASLDEVTIRDTKLRQQAAASQTSMSAAAAIRVVDDFGVDPKGIRPDSEATKLVTAIKNREATFDGKPMYEVMRADSLASIFKRSGASDAALTSLQEASRDSIGNQETIHANRLGDWTRETQQPLEIIAQVGATAGRHAVVRALESLGVNIDEARRLGDDLGPELILERLNMDPKDLSDPKKRHDLIETALVRKMGRDRVTPDMVAAVGMNLETYGNASAKSVGFGNMTQMIQSMHQQGLGGGERAYRMAEAEALIDGELSQFGKADWAQRLVDALQKPGLGDEDLLKFLNDVSGNIDFGKDKDGKSNAEHLKTAIVGLREVAAMDRRELTQDDLVVLNARREKHLDTLQTVSKAARESADKNGLDVGRKTSDPQMSAAAQSGEDVSAILADTKMTQEDRDKKLLAATSLQSARTKSVVQSLYIDEMSLKKLGKGGLGRVQQVEAARLEMLRLAGGDQEKLADILAGKAGTPEEQARMRQLQGTVSSEIKDIGNILRSAERKPMTDDEWEKSGEQKLYKEFIDERSARDEDQTSAMLGKLDTIGGMKLSKEDKVKLAEHMGKFGSDQRHDIGMAIKARAQLQVEADKQNISLDQLRDSKQFPAEFHRAGAFGDKDGFRTNAKDHEDLNSLIPTLDKFKPDAKTGSRDITLRGGNIKVDLVRGTASLDLAGTTDFSNHV